MEFVSTQVFQVCEVSGISLVSVFERGGVGTPWIRSIRFYSPVTQIVLHFSYGTVLGYVKAINSAM